MSVEVGSIVEGKVVSVMPFGAFVQIEDSKTTGLVHISEVAEKYVKDISEHLSAGDRVKVKVLKIDEKGKISLSIKKAKEEQRQKRNERRAAREAEAKKEPIRPAQIDWSRRTGGLSFEDMLGKFKQDSDENMQALKRSAESKRSGGYKRGR